MNMIVGHWVRPLVALKVHEARPAGPSAQQSLFLPHPSDLVNETLTFARPSCKILSFPGKEFFPSDLCPNDFLF